MSLKDVADRAGVSIATVSNVINGNYNKVSEKTIEHVRRIIEEMNYNPSAVARSLASHESRIIAVFIPNMMMEGAFGIDPYASQLVALIEQGIRREGCYMMLRCVNRCREITSLTRSWNPDGIILLGADPDDVHEISRIVTEIPVVYTDTYANDIPISNIRIDDYKGGYLSAEYLLRKGHRQIALVSPDWNTSSVISERFRGFCDALNEYGLEFSQEDFFMAETRVDDGFNAGNRIISSGRKYTAAAAMSDTIAMGLNASFQKHGFRVPDDISLIGFDNIEASAYIAPALTTVAQDLEKKALLVEQQLFEMIRTKTITTVNEVLDVEVIERDSVRDLTVSQ